MVEFLKKSNKNNRFIIPIKNDLDEISLNVIVAKIGDPQIEATGKRYFYMFNIPLFNDMHFNNESLFYLKNLC